MFHKSNINIMKNKNVHLRPLTPRLPKLPATPGTAATPGTPVTAATPGTPGTAATPGTPPTPVTPDADTMPGSSPAAATGGEDQDKTHLTPSMPSMPGLKGAPNIFSFGKMPGMPKMQNNLQSPDTDPGAFEMSKFFEIQMDHHKRKHLDEKGNCKPHLKEEGFKYYKKYME